MEGLQATQASDSFVLKIDVSRSHRDSPSNLVHVCFREEIFPNIPCEDARTPEASDIVSQSDIKRSRFKNAASLFISRK